MSKKHEQHEDDEQTEKIEKKTKSATKSDGQVHLKVLADLFTREATYVQGQVIEVTVEQVPNLMLEYAGYFEIITE